MLKYFFNRLREPSSMAGLAIVLGLFGVPLAPEALQAGGSMVAGVAGLLAIFMSEKK